MTIFDLFYKEHAKRQNIETLVKDSINDKKTVQEIMAALSNNHHATLTDSYLIAFKLSCQMGLFDLFSELIKLQEVKDNIDFIDNTPLREAAAAGHANMVTELLKFPRVKENVSNSALRTAATAGHADVVNALIECPKMIEELTNPSADDTPILGAFINGYRGIVMTLMQYAGQMRSLEEYLNAHLSSYQEDMGNVVSFCGESVYFAKCEEHPALFPSMELYKKSVSVLKQPQRELSEKEKALIAQKRASGTLSEAEVARINKVLNMPGTKLNKNMTSVNDALKVSRKYFAKS